MLLTPYLKKLKLKTQKRLTSRYARNDTKESGQRTGLLRIHLAHGRSLDKQYEMWNGDCLQNINTYKHIYSQKFILFISEIMCINYGPYVKIKFSKMLIS